MLQAHDLAERIRAGERRALARAITLVESTRDEHRAVAVDVLEHLGAPGDTLRLGITGVPGAGKSTFIEAFGMRLIEAGHRVAVLSIDPTSAISGGSILGDKTRMEQLSRHPSAYIRPSPAGRTLGGVARRTRETLALCEAAGFDIVIIETVGVGQSETAVASMTDMFLLLLVPGGGDDLQGIKRGIVELADLVLVNKADGELVNAARRAAADYANAFGLIRPRSQHWRTRVAVCSSLHGDGVSEAWDTVYEYWTTLKAAGELAGNRARQARANLWDEVAETLLAHLRADPAHARRLAEFEDAVQSGVLSPSVAAERLVAEFRAAAAT
ncbi:MAG: methylmalonyl Co-A mutase-associated GTPase MeaB [Pseudomonadota bacterium]